MKYAFFKVSIYKLDNETKGSSGRVLKLIRHLDQRDLRDLETRGPLVAPSLRSGRHSPGPSGF